MVRLYRVIHAIIVTEGIIMAAERAGMIQNRYTNQIRAIQHRGMLAIQQQVDIQSRNIEKQEQAAHSHAEHIK